MQEGLSKNYPKTLQRMDQARKNVLNNLNLWDARLSPNGQKQAESAREALRHILAKNPELPQPEYVVVSPLTRDT
jgi:broad specificity phosphatase PhoE